MHMYVTGLLKALWQRSIVRYALIHGILGVLFSILSDHLVGFGVGRYWGTLLGYAPYIFLGFFIDRAVTYRSPETHTIHGMFAYCVSEVVTFLLTLAVVFVTIEFGVAARVLDAVWGQKLLAWCEAFGFAAGDPEYTIARGPVGLPVSGLVSFSLNKWITFGLMNRIAK